MFNPPIPYSYLIVEDAPDTCTALKLRMDPYPSWHCVDSCGSVLTAIEAIKAHRPALIFLDWSIKGGNAFDVLDVIEKIAGYTPYIILNTAWQSDEPSIPQTALNNYRIDKYLVKPVWPRLRQLLPGFLLEAAARAENAHVQTARKTWIPNAAGTLVAVDWHLVVTICQNELFPRIRDFHFYGMALPQRFSIGWADCKGALELAGIAYFMARERGCLVVRNFVEGWARPVVLLRGTGLTVEVVKEKAGAFEGWLLEG